MRFAATIIHVLFVSACGSVPMRLFLAFLAICCISSSAPIPAYAQTDITKDEAVKLISTAYAAYLSPAAEIVERTACTRDPKGNGVSCCGSIPIGNYQLNFQTEGLTRLISRFEKAGIITVSNVNTNTGNVFNDLANISRTGGGSTVRTEIAPGIDAAELSVIIVPRPGGSPLSFLRCFIFGKPTIKDIVRFDKIHGTGPDGIGFDAYVLQGTYSYEPSRLELRLYPTIERDRKFQAIIKYDPFSKRWGILAEQGVGISETFNAAYFASKLGHQ